MVVFIWGLARSGPCPPTTGGGGDAARLICTHGPSANAAALAQHLSPSPSTHSFFSYGAVNNKEKQKQTNKELTNFNERRRAAVAAR